MQTACGDPWGGLTSPGLHSPESYNPQPICLTYVPPLQRALCGIAFTRRLEQAPSIVVERLKCSVTHHLFNIMLLFKSCMFNNSAPPVNRKFSQTSL